MKAKTLWALSRLAPSNGNDVGEILAALACGQDAIEHEAAKDRRIKIAEQGREDADRRRIVDVKKAEDEREAARKALGDGWHPLKSGGAIFSTMASPFGSATAATTATSAANARTRRLRRLAGDGWRWLELTAEPPWTEDGEAAVRPGDDIPF